MFHWILPNKEGSSEDDELINCRRRWAGERYGIPSSSSEHLLPPPPPIYYLILELSFNL